MTTATLSSGYNFGVDDYIGFIPPTSIKPAWWPKVGDEIRVTLSGTVCPADDDHDFCYVGTSAAYGALYLSDRKVELTSMIRLGAPTWKVGDVITLRYIPTGPEYTYVRGRNDWPGDGFPRSDTTINEYYRRGLVRHLLRDAKPVKA